MSLWNKTGSRPKGLSKKDNRHVVVTDRGFEKNIVSGTRIKREILVPLNSLTSTFPKPGVTDVWCTPASSSIVVTPLSGTVATTNSSTTVTGTNTKFQTELVVGNKIRIGASMYATVATISSNTSLTITAGASGTTSAQALAKFTVPTVTTKIAFAEPLSAAAASKIVINNVTGGGTINAVATAPVSGDNILRFTWTPVYPGNYTISTQAIANNTSTAINLRSTNQDLETANTTISASMASAMGTFVLNNG